MKINFKRIESQNSFKGGKQTFDNAETVVN